MDADGTGKMSRRMETAGVPFPKMEYQVSMQEVAGQLSQAMRRDGHIYQCKRERSLADLQMVSPAQLLKPVSVSTLTGRYGFRILVNIHYKMSLQ